MKKLSDTIKSIDAFGGIVTFRVDDRYKQKSYLGGFVTILLGMFLIVLSYVFSKDFFEKKNPKISSHRIYNSDNITIEFTKQDKFNFVIHLCKDIGKKCEFQFNQSLFRLKADYVTVVSNDDSKDYSAIPLNVSQCRKEDFHVDVHSKFDELSLSKALCVDTQNVTLLGQYESKVFKYIRIRLEQCDSNSSPVPCASTEDIKKELGLWKMSYYFTFDLEDLYNFYSPKLKKIANEGFSLSFDYFKRVNIFYKNNILVTDDYFFIENQIVTNKSLISFEDKDEELQKNTQSSPLFFGNIYVRTSPTQTIFKRVYKKVPDIFAEVGGILNYTVVVLILFFSFYNTFLLKINLFNDLNLEKMNSNDYKENSISFLEPLHHINDIQSKSMIEDNCDKIRKKEQFKFKIKQKNKEKVTCLNIVFYKIFCCRRGKCDKNINFLYEEISENLLKQLDLFRYISFQNKFFYLCKFILDKDQLNLFSTLTKPSFYLDENNEMNNEKFLMGRIKEKSLFESYKRIMDKREKTELDSWLLELNNDLI